MVILIRKKEILEFTYSGQGIHKDLSVIRCHLGLLGESLGHGFKILACDRSVLIEVNPVEISLHLLNPQVRHDGSCCSVGHTL